MFRATTKNFNIKQMDLENAKAQMRKGVLEMCILAIIGEEDTYGKAISDRLKAHIRAAGLPAGIGDLSRREGLDADALLAAMRQDKKVVGGRFNLILARRIGEAFIAADVDQAAVKAFLDRAIRTA